MAKHEIGSFYLESIRDFYSKISNFLSEIVEEHKSVFAAEDEESKVIRLNKEKARFVTQKQKLVFKALVAQAYNYSIIEGEYYSTNAETLLKDIAIIHQEVQEKIADQPFEDLIEKPVALSGTVPLQSEDLIQQLSAERLAFFSEVVELTEYYPEFNRHYQYFVDKVKHRLEQTDGEDILDHDFDADLSELKNIPSNSASPSTAPSTVEMYYHLFLLNIKLAEFDEGYEGYVCDQAATKSLIQIILMIQNRFASGLFLHNLISDCLSEKCNFLLLKIYRRYKKDAIDYIITAQKQEKKFNLSSLEGTIKLFKTFNEKSYRHYNPVRGFFSFLSTSKNDISALSVASEFRDNLASSKESDLTIEHIHFVCKFIRSNSSTIVSGRKAEWDYPDVIEFLETLLEKIITEKKDKISSNSKTDFYAFESVTHLVKNVIFNLKAENVFSCDRTVDGYLAEVRPLTQYYRANKTIIENSSNIDLARQGLPDPFLSKIYCSLLHRLYGKIRDILAQKKESITEKQSDAIAEVSGEYFNADTTYVKLLTLASKQGLMPIYLSISECISQQQVSTDDYKEWFDFHFALKDIKVPDKKKDGAVEVLKADSGLNIFLDSGYISPINYHKLFDEHKEEKNEVVNLIAFISTLVTLAPLQTYKNEIDAKFDSKVKESQYTAVQLVGFFIGVITFILSSVSVVPKFNNGNSFEVVFTFMLVFAGSLVLFTLVIAYLTRFKIKATDSRWYDDLLDAKFILIILLSLALIVCGCVAIFKFSGKGLKAEDVVPKVQVTLPESSIVNNPTQPIPSNTSLSVPPKPVPANGDTKPNKDTTHRN